MPKMTLSEALAEGLQVIGVGLIIVFAVLIILMLVMMAMKNIFYKADKPEKRTVEKVSIKNETPTPVITDRCMDEGELIAVLTAAVAVSMDVPTNSLKIKSFKRVGSSLPVWNRAGVRDIIDSRF